MTTAATPVVVAGQLVEGQQKENDGDTPYYSNDNSGVNKVNNLPHEYPQQRRCNDVFFAILFIVHLMTMAFASAKYIPSAANLAQEYAGANYNNVMGKYNNNNNRRLRRQFHVDTGNIRQGWRVKGQQNNKMQQRLLQQEDDNNYYYFDNNDQYEDNINYYDGTYDSIPVSDATTSEIVTLVGTVGCLAMLCSSLNLYVMVHFARRLIKAALVFNILTIIFSAIISFLAGNVTKALIASFFALLALWFACSVWSRIPFAASNLVTATTAIRTNLGVTTFAYTDILVTFLWNLWWIATVSSFTAVVVYQKNGGQWEQQDGGNNNNNDEQAQAISADPTTAFIMFLFFLSYYWTYQVIKNHLHVTVAGVVGTWWFTPEEASSCCSSAICPSWCRASTTSFGSICFGSLVVAIVQAIREMLQMTREADDTGILLCIIDCCLGCIESLAEYFNQWAYVYVGLYGYNFIDSAQHVMRLFQNRSWTTIITDILIDRVLLLLSVMMGLFMGFVALITAVIQNIHFSEEYGGAMTPFMIGFMLGLGLNSVLMKVIGSAVNTVIVCFAEAPNDFQQNHPQLSEQMTMAWSQAYPDQFQPVPSNQQYHQYQEEGDQQQQQQQMKGAMV